jgi:hypothetical protein
MMGITCEKQDSAAPLFSKLRGQESPDFLYQVPLVKNFQHKRSENGDKK